MDAMRATCFCRNLVLQAFLLLPSLPLGGRAADTDVGKEESVRGGLGLGITLSQTKGEVTPAGPGGAGYRFAVSNEAVHVPVVVVGGTPYQMGWHLGRLMKTEIQRYIPAALEGFKQKLDLKDEELDQVWATTAALTLEASEWATSLISLAHLDGLPLTARWVVDAIMEKEESLT